MWDDDRNLTFIYKFFYSYALAGDSKDFKIDSESGEISTVRELDREMKDVYDLTIIATDGGVLSNSGTAAVTVIVDDVNEYPPVFEKQIYKAAARMPTLAGKENIIMIYKHGQLV